jgi:large subunit ribosomal protein L35
MERIYQMNVVPDIVSSIHPTLDLRITTGSRPKSIHPKAKNPLIVEPGSFLTPKQAGSLSLPLATFVL